MATKPPDTLVVTLEGPFLQLLERRGGAVRRWARVPVAATPRGSGHIVDEGAIAAAVRQLPSGFFRGGLRVVAALPSFGAAWRILTLPPMPRRVLAPAVERQTQRLFPGGDALSTTWGIVGGGGRDPWQLYLLAVPREPLLALVRALVAAGLQPQVVDLRSIGLLRAAGLGTCVAVAGDPAAIEIAIALDGVPLVVRATYLGPDGEDSDYLERRIVDEALRSVGYLGQELRDRPFPADAPVVLGGRAALQPGVAAALQEATGRSVVAPQPGVKPPPGLPVEVVAAAVGSSLW